jgi:two-component system, OmpR family, sensor histidine kinase QseC
MTSLRQYLIISILASLALANFLAALHGYRTSMAEAQSLFDHKLMAASRRLLAMPLPDHVLPPAPGSEGDELFQLVDGAGRVVWRSENAPADAITVAPGFSEANLVGYRWRILSSDAEPPLRRAIVAERTDLRYNLAESVVLQSVLPVLLVLPLAGLLIWLIVGHGLKSLSELANLLRRRSADDFSELAIEPPPSELVPVVSAINSSLRRLGAAFERERRFSADAAHELRTPISAINMHLHNALADPDSAAESLQKLEPDVQRLSHLVEQLLLLNRASAEHFAGKFEVLSLQELGRECIAQRYGDFDRRSQQIELLGEDCRVAGDRFALQILIENLLRNANKYCPEGARVELCIARKGAGVELCVRDDGPGIPVNERERIFERFYRAGGDRHSSGVAGCGLGLSIVSHIADLHDARLSTDVGIDGRGLAICVFFPECRLSEEQQ